MLYCSFDTYSPWINWVDYLEIDDDEVISFQDRKLSAIISITLSYCYCHDIVTILQGDWRKLKILEIKKYSRITLLSLRTLPSLLHYYYYYIIIIMMILSILGGFEQLDSPKYPIIMIPSLARGKKSTIFALTSSAGLSHENLTMTKFHKDFK